MKKKFLLLIAMSAILVSNAVSAQESVLKNQGFDAPLVESAKEGEWYTVFNKAAKGKSKVEIIEDSQKGNVVLLENNSGAAWYSYYVAQVAEMNANMGAYVLSFDAKAVSGAPVIRAFIYDVEAEGIQGEFISRLDFDVKSPKTATHSPAAPTIKLNNDKWRKVEFKFDPSKSVNSFYSPNAVKKAGKKIEYTKLKGDNKFIVAIQVSNSGASAVIDNVKLTPIK